MAGQTGRGEAFQSNFLKALRIKDVSACCVVQYFYLLQCDSLAPIPAADLLLLLHPELQVGGRGRALVHPGLVTLVRDAGVRV